MGTSAVTPERNVSYHHPYDRPLEHTINIDFVKEAFGPGAREAVDAAPTARKTIEAVLAQADQRGVLEDIPVAAAPAPRPSTT